MAKSRWARMKAEFWTFIAWTARPPEYGDADREAIWSMPRLFRHAYFNILFLIWLPVLVDQAAKHRADWVNEPLWLMPAKLFGAMDPGIGGIGIAAAITALMIVQGASYIMVMYQSLANRFVRPVIERHVAEGHAQGAQAQNELWMAWLRRKEAAEADGMEFNEPPPQAPGAPGS